MNGCFAIPFPQLLGDDKDVAQQAFDGGIGVKLPLLALVGAVVVARRLETRSICSGRIHTGKAAAPPAARRGRGRGDTRGAFRRVPYAEVLRTLLRLGDQTKPICVVDEDSNCVGKIVRSGVVEPDASMTPLGITTPADFVR